MDSGKIGSRDDIVRYYQTINVHDRLALGIEWERSGVYRDTLAPVPYKGNKGYLAILKRLVSELGWEVEEEVDGNIYALRRGNARITTEADGRLELSGSPNLNLHDLARELRLYKHELKEMSDLYNILPLPIGWQPFHQSSDIGMLEKKRYRRFLPMKLMEDMMKKDNGLTVNVSYINEADCIEKAQIAFRISPIFSAIFASSPFDNGRLTGILSHRRQCIFNMAPGRCSVPENILESSFSLSDWIDYYCDRIPVVYFRRDGREYFPEDLTFPQWISEGYEGIFPRIRDFDDHVKSTWSDIRLRPSYLEYRVADTVPFSLAVSVPALMKGLFLDSENWNNIDELTSDWTYEDILALEQETWTHGLKTCWKGRDFLWYAQELLQFANRALHAFRNYNEQGEDETVFLIPLKEQIYIKEKSIAEELRDLWTGEYNQDPARLLDFFSE